MKKILAAVDFSDVSAKLIDRAESLARAFAGELWLLHVAAPDPEFVGYEVGPQNVRDQVAHRLRREHRDLQAKAKELRDRGVEATALLVQGPTVETILNEAERLGADLVIVGSHGRGALYRAVLGSVSEGVLRRSHCPLLIVPSRGD